MSDDRPISTHLTGLAKIAAEQGWWKWAVCITASFAAILEVIDVSIINVALPYMQGNLGATLSEIGWVSTGYSIANVIIIPLATWLGHYFGKKRYFVFSLIAFTLASIICGLAQDLTTLIIGRVLQGLGGGGLLAKAQALMFETFSKKDQATATMIFTLGVMCGPIIGPALGGYLTDALGWRWIFFINVPLGFMAVLMSTTFLAPDQPEDRLREDIDWSGIFFLAVGLGCLQTVLEQGQQDDWFDSVFIQRMVWLSVIGLGLFIWQELRIEHPAVNLRVLRYPSLAMGSIVSLVVGMGLYGTVFVVPIFSQTVLAFTATKTGLLLVPGGIISGLGIFVLSYLSKRFQPRVLIFCGAIWTIGVMLSLSQINSDTSAEDFFWPLIGRGLASILMFIPLSLATLGSVPLQDVSAASGFFSLTRQLGGSIGIAAITTLITRFEIIHRSQLIEHLDPTNLNLQDRLDANQTRFDTLSGDPVQIQNQALALLDQAINTQAQLLSFRDIFLFVALIFLLSLPLILLLPKPRTTPVPAETH